MAVQYVVGDSMSPFMKRVLIPFWVVRILFMAIQIIIYGLAIGFTIAASSRSGNHYNSFSGRAGGALAIAIVVAILIIVCLALDIVCIVKRARRTLSPRFFLIVNVIQTVFWAVMFILSMVGVRTTGTVVLGVCMFLSFLGLLIYASVIYHRQRKGTLPVRYAPAAMHPQYQGYYAQSPGYPQPGYPQPNYPQPPYQHTGYQQAGYQPASPAFTGHQQQSADPYATQQPTAGAYEMGTSTRYA